MWPMDYKLLPENKLVYILLVLISMFSLNVMGATKSMKNTPELLPYLTEKEMNEKDYELYLEQKLLGFDEGGISANLGFAILKWKDHFSVEVKLVPMPNLFAKDATPPYQNEDGWFGRWMEVHFLKIINDKGEDILIRNAKEESRRGPNSMERLGFPNPPMSG